MAKLTLTDGTIFEGTTEEIFAITERFNGAKADETTEAESPYEFKVGDRVEITNYLDSRYEDLDDGDIGEITDVGAFHETPLRVETDDDYDFFPASALRKVEVDKPKVDTLKVGDYAVVEGYSAEHNGTLVELTSKWTMERDKFDVMPIVDSSVRSMGVKYLRKATDEEVAEAKAKAEALAEQAAKEAELTQKFTQAGRKPNEYRKGDIVRTIYVEGGIRNGHAPDMIGEVTSDTIVVNKKSFNPSVLINGISLLTNVEPVTFVESRLDRN